MNPIRKLEEYAKEGLNRLLEILGLLREIKELLRERDG